MKTRVVFFARRRPGRIVRRWWPPWRCGACDPHSPRVCRLWRFHRGMHEDPQFEGPP